jgi:hypothetical protein
MIDLDKFCDQLGIRARSRRQRRRIAEKMGWRVTRLGHTLVVDEERELARMRDDPMPRGRARSVGLSRAHKG